MNDKKFTRRAVAKGLTLSFGALALPSVAIAPARAQAKSVKIALIAPLSGPWARQGQLLRMGADMAVEDINGSGGIKSARRRQARDRLRRCRRQHRKGQERGAAPVVGQPRPGRRDRRVAQLVHSGGDRGDRARVAAVADAQLFRRDHQSRVQVRLPDLADRRLARRRRPCRPRSSWRKTATGKRPKTVGIIMDNTASPVSFTKPLRAGGLEKAGLKLVVDQVFTPPLSDATPLDREGALGQARFPAAADLGDARLQAGARKARRVQARRTARSRWSATARRSARPNC